MSNENFTYNDTIYLSGTTQSSTTWTSTLYMTKGCTVKGAGKDVITITGNIGASAFILVYGPDGPSMSNNYQFKVSGIHFVGLNGEQAIQLISGGWGPSRLSVPPTTNNIIVDNKFENLINAVWDQGPMYGVMSDNDIFNCKVPVRGIGWDYTTWDEFGAIDWRYDGTSQSDCAKHQTGINSVSCFLYGEDNFIQFNNDFAFGNIAWTSAGESGRFVIRNNTYDFTGASKTGCSGWPCMINEFESHDSRGNTCPHTAYDPSYAPMGAIFYGNLAKHDQPTIDRRVWAPFIGRGGKVVVAHNFWTDMNSYPMGFSIYNQFMDGCVADYNVSVQHINDSYLVNNYFETSLIETSMGKDGCYGWEHPQS